MWNLKDKLTGQFLNGYGSDFGRNVSCNFDGSIALIGGATDSEGIASGGAAWIYTGNRKSGWDLKQKITGSQFNGRLSRHGMNRDGNIIVLGAFGDDNYSGVAYIYTGNAINGWKFKQELRPSAGTVGNAWFGRTSKANDNGNVIVIGAQNDNQAGLLAGSTQVFTGNPEIGSWSHAQTLTGQRVSGGMNRGAINGDGSVIVAGGFPYASSTNPVSIRDPKPFVIIYTGNPQLGRWAEKQRVSGTNLPQFYKDGFGIVTDISQDGKTIVVGSPWEDHQSRNLYADNQAWTYRGAMYIYTGDPINGWNVHWKTTGAFPTAAFGWNVSISRDGNTIVVGSQSNHPFWGRNNFWCTQGNQLACNENNLSYASIYQKNTIPPTINNPGGWSLIQDTEKDFNKSEYGTYIDTSDNGNTIFIGGPWDPTAGNNAGIVQVYTKALNKILGIGKNITESLINRLYLKTTAFVRVCSPISDCRTEIKMIPFYRDFAKFKTLNHGTGPAITFTRADATTCATYFDANGVLQLAAANVPRFDHDPITKISRGLLIEESRENLLQRSAEFDNAYWFKQLSTITPNAITAPDGTLTADKVEANSTTGIQVSRDVVVNASSATFTVFLKKGSGATGANVVQLRNNTTSANIISIRVNLDTGAITTLSGSGSATATNVGNGWWRVALSGGLTSGNSVKCTILSNFVESHTAGEFVYAWGAQLEAGAFPTSYIPTTSAAVTRAADLAFVTPISLFYNASEGTLFVEARTAAFAAYRYLATITEGAALATRSFDMSKDASNNFESYSVVNNVEQYAIDRTGWDGSGTNKAIAAIRTDDVAVVLNGGAVGTDTSATMATTVNRLTIGCRGDGSLPLNGHIRKIAYWPRRLSDVLLKRLTT